MGTRPRLGLVLGGGAARGWSHIGVIDALTEAGIMPDMVAGTSMGALVGAVQAGGKLDALKHAALELDWKELVYRFAEWGPHRSGLVDGAKLVDFIRPHLAAATIEGLPVPYACVATDLLAGLPVILTRGDLLQAVRCSISIPGLFTPVYHQERVLVDGGVTNPVPVDAGRQLGADIVVAVDINYGRLDQAALSVPTSQVRRLKDFLRRQAGERRDTWKEKLALRLDEKIDPERLGALKKVLDPDPLPGLFDVLGNSIMVMEAQITELNLRLHRPEILIRPPVSSFRIMDFDKAADIIEIGYQAGRAALPAIFAALESFPPQ